MSEPPQGWSQSTLAEVAKDISYGFTTSAADSEENPKLLRITDVQDYSVEWSDVPFCKDAPPDDKLLSSGDIVIARTGATTGKSYLLSDIPTETAFASYLIRVRSSDAVDPEYLWKFMWSPDYWRQITVVSKGTAQPGANASILGSLELPIPPLPEQRRIVAKLDRLSARSAAAREHLARTTKLATRAKQATLRSAFNGVLTGHSEFSVEPPNYDYYWPIPEGWEWRQVRDVGDVSLGRQRSPKNHSGPFMRPYIRAANITWRGIDTSDVLEMNFDAADFARFHLEPGDVLLNEGSGSAKEVGKPAIWHGEIEDCCFQNTVLRVKPRLCSSEYLYWYFYATALAEGFVSNTQGINIQHIGKKGLADFYIPHPPEDEQAKIVRRIEAAFTRIDRMTEEASRAAHLLARLDERLLAKAFRGELVPQDPDDEPAEDLLTRIREARAAAPKAKRGRRRKAEA